MKTKKYISINYLHIEENLDYNNNIIESLFSFEIVLNIIGNDDDPKLQSLENGDI